MDELRFYDGAISELEVQKLADYSTYTRYFRGSNDDGLSGYWPFDQGLIDKSGNGNHGKIIPLVCKHGLFTRWETFLFCQGCRGDKNCETNLYGLDRSFCPAEDPSTEAHQEILGITLDPYFAANHFVYAYVVVKDGNTGNIFSRVMRFTESENRATDRKILIDNIPARNGPFLSWGTCVWTRRQTLRFDWIFRSNRTRTKLQSHRQGLAYKQGWNHSG